jgi:HTH-type transcriptional regulator / antitoxin HigA
MSVKTIKSKADYDKAMARLSAFMSHSTAAESKEDNELELLAQVVCKYEHQTVPPVKVDFIEFVLFRMEQMALNPKELVPFIGSISMVSEVLTRKRPLTMPMIRRLSLGLDPC